VLNHSTNRDSSRGRGQNNSQANQGFDQKAQWGSFYEKCNNINQRTLQDQQGQLQPNSSAMQQEYLPPISDQNPQRMTTIDGPGPQIDRVGTTNLPGFLPSMVTQPTQNFSQIQRNQTNAPQFPLNRLSSHILRTSTLNQSMVNRQFTNLQPNYPQNFPVQYPQTAFDPTKPNGPQLMMNPNIQNFIGGQGSTNGSSNANTMPPILLGYYCGNNLNQNQMQGLFESMSKTYQSVM
jgi:hypothetical protein